MYQELISKILAEDGLEKFDPRHVEAYMRLQFSNLDGLSPEDFRTEVKIGTLCVEFEGAQIAENLARSFGI